MISVCAGPDDVLAAAWQQHSTGLLTAEGGPDVKLAIILEMPCEIYVHGHSLVILMGSRENVLLHC